MAPMALLSRSVALLSLLLAVGNAKLDSEFFTQKILEQYNFYRSLHGVKSVTLNRTMSQNCEKYAEKLGSRMMARPCLVHSRKNGENLMFYWNYAQVTEKDLAEFTVKEFYDEIKFYNFNRPGFIVPAAHFTQMIWKGVSEIGVGLFERKFTKNSFGDCHIGTQVPAYAYFIVIHHNPEGNRFEKDQFLNNVLSPKRRVK
uniref:SCP domain-containing protein n=1 Tax=Steinernema glaseri TaxID=37863 RepID=A0A1I8ASF5_9BILA